MSSPFTAAAADAATDLLATFGESATLHLPGGDQVFTGIYGRPWTEEDLGAAELRRPDPVLELRSGDLDGLVGVVAGLEVTVGGTIHTVIGVESDDAGVWTRLPLRVY